MNTYEKILITLGKTEDIDSISNMICCNQNKLSYELFEMLKEIHKDLPSKVLEYRLENYFNYYFEYFSGYNASILDDSMLIILYLLEDIYENTQKEFPFENLIYVYENNLFCVYKENYDTRYLIDLENNVRVLDSESYLHVFNLIFNQELTVSITTRDKGVSKDLCYCDNPIFIENINKELFDLYKNILLPNNYFIHCFIEKLINAQKSLMNNWFMLPNNKEIFCQTSVLITDLVNIINCNENKKELDLSRENFSLFKKSIQEISF